jgi:tRNA nucleotidyltransferase/poly(A) polymerase
MMEKVDFIHKIFGLKESSNLKLKIPSDILKIHKAFKKSGKKLYVVGGAVRDAILGDNPKDFDLATDAKPDEVLKIAKDNKFSTAEVGKSFGVVIVNGNEIATFRKDIGKGRRPSSVDYTDIEGDVRRRDLTVNALFYDLDKKEIVDLVGGIADLKKKKIRTVGKAEERFEEDPLRKLRALRFQARLGGTFDKDLLSSLQKDPTLKGVSSERIRDEFVKSLKSAKNPQKYMEMNDKIGFTKLILPNLKVTKPYISDNDYILFLSSILRKNPASYLSKTLNKLTYSNDERNNIVFLVSLQQFKPEEVLVYKKAQSKTSLSDEQIIKFGSIIGKDMKKFVNFKLSVGGKDVPKDIKGPEIGMWIKNKEKENFLNENLKQLGITDFKSLFKKMPSDLQKRVYNLKNFGQRLDKHPEGNVLKHTIVVVNRSIKDDDIDIAIAAMFHDIGKDETAGIHPKKGHITHFGHEKVSASLVSQYRDWVKSVGGNPANVFYIVKNHMRYKQLDDMRIKKVMKLKSFRAFDKLSKFSKHDRGGLGEGIINEGGRILRVFDFDDTLAKSTAFIYVKHKDGSESKLDPAQYAKYNSKSTDVFDFRDFNKMLNKPKVIQKNFKLLQKMLNNPNKKVTILTARKLAFPIRKFFKDQFGMEVYVVALGSNNPKDKSDWIEKHIKKGYTDIAFMDDSSKNIRAVDKLKSKYPDVRIKTHLVREHIDEEVQKYVNKLIH